MTRLSCDVLVVGAGPAGLTAAIALARHGVDVLVVERHAGTSPFPKATGISTRTVELLRSWGLDGRVRAGAMAVRPYTVVSETLVGPELGTLPFGYPTEEQAHAVSPVAPVYCPQDHLEPVLLAHLLERGGTVRHRTELTDLQLRDEDVRAELRDRDTGARTTVTARWVIGADGPRSTVRTALGIGFDDVGRFGDHVAVTFRAELTRRLPRTPGAINSVEVPAASGLFIATGNDRWIYARQERADQERADQERADRDGTDPGRTGPEAGADQRSVRRRILAAWTPQRCRAMVRVGAGLPDLPLEILSVQAFEIAAQVAPALRRGRGFLVGDAAHRTTPMGGTGMNVAIHAAHNLGWKLAWVLRGWADPALLDSYPAERLPVGVAAVHRSVRTGPDPEPDGGLLRDLGVRYTSAVLDAGTGERAPHAWLRRAGARLSTLDLFDGRLTLLTGPCAARWRGAAAGPAGAGVPLVVRSVGSPVVHGLAAGVLAATADLHAEDTAFAERYRLGDTGAVLVRPDGYVAWRHPGDTADEPAALAGAVARALGRPAGSVPTPARPAEPSPAR